MLRRLVLALLLAIPVAGAAIVHTPATPTFACVKSGNDCYNFYSTSYSVTNSITGHSSTLSVRWQLDTTTGVLSNTSCTTSQSAGVTVGPCNGGGSCTCSSVQASAVFNDTDGTHWELFITQNAGGTSSKTYSYW